MILGFKASTAVVIRVKLQGTFTLPGLDINNGDVTIEHDLGPDGEIPLHLSEQLAMIARGDIDQAVADAVKNRPLPQK